MVEIPDSAVWYVKAMVMRGLDATESALEKMCYQLNSMNDKDTFYECLASQIAYTEQLIRETKSELAFIPELNRAI